MPPIAALGPRVKAFVFDAYGTLFDVHAAVSRHAGAIGKDAMAFSELWRTKQLEYSWTLSLAGQWTDFWILTQRALDVAFARFPGVDPALRPHLLAAYRQLDAFPEVAGVLTRLRQAGYRTGILSNGETGMLADAVASAGIGPLLDAVLSVDAVQVFKTSPATYQLVNERLDLASDQVAFVSSNRWDVAGAAAFGFRPLWVNRRGLPAEYPGLEPVATLLDLSGLA